jgi:uncharacterized damage-inducible protein DinB
METARISQLFSQSYNGEPWIDVTTVGTLADVSAEKAAKKLTPSTNSIWEIVNHLVAWRENVLERVNGKVLTTPEHNYFTAVEDTSEAAWKASLAKLENTQQQWIAFLESFDENQFDTIYPNNGLNYYQHIHGILHHDAYHLGQIVLLKKLLS